VLEHRQRRQEMALGQSKEWLLVKRLASGRSMEGQGSRCESCGPVDCLWRDVASLEDRP